MGTFMIAGLGLRALLVDDDPARAQALQQALREQGHVIVAHLDRGADLLGAARTHQATVVFVGVEELDGALLAALTRMHEQQPLPVVVFAGHSDAQTTRRALAAGVSAYVVDGFHPSRLGALLELATARFELHQALRKDLEYARTRLADNRDIEKAKGVLMQRRGMSEAAAYGLLRRMAMERKQRIGEFARTLLNAAEAL